MSTSRLLVLAATLPVFTNYVIQLNDWFCGNRYIVSYISHMFMAGDCQGYAATVNHCCAYHDECYSLQRGQTTCDEEFCDCLEDASEGSPTFCHILIMGKCQLVIGFGVSTYKDSKMDTPLDIARVSVDTVDMRDAVDHLYDACPWIKKIVKSCVLLYNFCFRANRTEACKISFEKCLKDAAAYHPANECMSAVEHVFPGAGANAELGRTWRWSIPSRLRPFEFRTLIVVGFLGVSLCLITAVVACVLMCKGKENEDLGDSGQCFIDLSLGHSSKPKKKRTSAREKNPSNRPVIVNVYEQEKSQDPSISAEKGRSSKSSKKSETLYPV